MFFRQFLNDETACASYLFGCKSKEQFAVVDPHVDLVADYVAAAEAQCIPITAVFETHVQADHVSGLPELVERTRATAYLPEGAGVEFDHRPLADDEVVVLGNTDVGCGHAGTCAGSPRLRGDRSHPWRGALVRPHRRRASGGGCRTARSARPRRGLG